METKWGNFENPYKTVDSDYCAKTIM